MFLVWLAREFIVGDAVSEMKTGRNGKVCLIFLNMYGLLNLIYSDHFALSNVPSILMQAVQADLHDQDLHG